MAPQNEQIKPFEPSCGGCRYFDAFSDVDEGFCRRHAPQPLPCVEFSGAVSGGEQRGLSVSVQGGAAWPVVNAVDDFCGEHQSFN